jgi:SOS-response transcriptional repressor LexA
MQKELTEAQKKVLRFIRGFIVTHNYPPTSREISDAFGWWQTGAVSHLKALRKKGAIDWQDRKPRTLTVK